MRFYIPEMTITTLAEAKQYDAELLTLLRKLRTFIDAQERKKNCPEVKMLNRLLAQGKTLLYEYGNHRGTTQKGERNAFNQKKDGTIAHCNRKSVGNCPNAFTISASAFRNFFQDEIVPMDLETILRQKNRHNFTISCDGNFPKGSNAIHNQK